MKKNSILFFLLFITCVVCAQGVKIVRFDKDFYYYLQTGDDAKILSAENAAFVKALAQTWNIVDSTNTEQVNALKTYFSHPALLKMYGDSEIEFSNLSFYEKQLNNALQLAANKMTVSDKTIFQAHVSGLKENVISVNNIISISLDKYLGADYIPYEYFFSAPQRFDMSPDMMVRDYLKAWLIYNYVNESNEDNLLSQMIFEGKIIYIISQLLPDYSFSQLLGKNDSDLESCRSLAKKNWKKIQANDLYSKDNNVIHQWMNEQNEIGVWLGYGIVNKYVANTNASIDELLKASDSEILKNSKYTP